MTSITPSGGHFEVKPCAPAPELQEYLCSDDWSGTFEVVFSAAIADPILTVRFVGFGACVEGFAQTPPLNAGQQVTLHVRRLSMMGNDDVPRLCPLPTTTTKIVVQLWGRSNPRTPLITEELAHVHTFDKAPQ